MDSHIGEPCTARSECAGDLQCFVGVCNHPCTTHFECGDGHLCDDGQCREVVSELGQACERELDCGPGQACALTAQGSEIIATCKNAEPGLGTGAECVTDDECRNSTCALGRCTQLCSVSEDCPLDWGCVTIPYSASSVFRGCMQADGVLDVRMPLTNVVSHLEIPVPDHARSLAIISDIGSNQLVGVTELISPTGAVLHRRPASIFEFLQNPIRYSIKPQLSTMLVPNSDAVKLDSGMYQARIGTYLPSGVPGTEVPNVRILYQFGRPSQLKLNIHFLDLEHHPCVEGGPLSAQTAAGHSGFTEFLTHLQQTFDAAGINITDVSLRDITNEPSLNTIEIARIGDLFELSDASPGIDVFIVRGLSPSGVQAIAGGSPGPPRTPGTRASGVAVALETVCYRSWKTLARSTAHAIGQHLGLFPTVNAHGIEDPLVDTGLETTNLMHYAEGQNIHLSAAQTKVLLAWPGLE